MPSSAPVDVHIWYQDTESLGEQDLELADAVLSAEERLQRDRFRFHESRRDYAMAHGLLRQSLSKFDPQRSPGEWQFEKDAFGKPHLRGDSNPRAATEFNLSHTTGFVACAISSVRIGIDVERIRETMDYASIAQSNYAQQELKLLLQLPLSERPARTIELWTLKEAYLKATGSGLSGPLDSIWFELLPGAIRFHGPAEVDTSAWRFALFSPMPGVRMAVAVDSATVPRFILQGGRRRRSERMTQFWE